MAIKMEVPIGISYYYIPINGRAHYYELVNHAGNITAKSKPWFMNILTGEMCSYWMKMMRKLWIQPGVHLIMQVNNELRVYRVESFLVISGVIHVQMQYKTRTQNFPLSDIKHLFRGYTDIDFTGNYS